MVLLENSHRKPVLKKHFRKYMSYFENYIGSAFLIDVRFAVVTHRQGIRCQEGGCLKLVSYALIYLTRAYNFLLFYWT